MYIQRISYFFSKVWYFKYHIIQSCSLKPFRLPLKIYHKKRIGRSCEHQEEEQKKVKEGVEVTLTQPRTYLEIQLNSEEITKNKQLNNSRRKASKPCTHGRTSCNTTFPHLHNRKQEVGDRMTLRKPAGGKDPPKKVSTRTKNQRHTQSQHKSQPMISKIGRSRRL